MKKLTLAVLAVIAGATLTAQTKNVQFGLKAGLNLSNVKIKNGADGKQLPGFHAGGLAHIHISRRFAVQPELMYSSQGTEQQIAGTPYTDKFHYINVPVLAQFMALNGLRVQSGPQFGYLLKAETNFRDVDPDRTEFHKKFDLAWAFGASYLSKIGIGVDARYNLGLSNAADVAGADRRHRVWQFGLFYQFK